MEYVTPISKKVLNESAVIRSSYREANPVERWAVIDDFLEPSLATGLFDSCRSGHYETFCGYAKPNDAEFVYRNEFHEPTHENAYITVHRRSQRVLPGFQEALEQMGAPPTIQALRELTGEPIERLAPNAILTSWQAGDFVEPHTDQGGPQGGTRLLLWVWLTVEWKAAYGGSTGFQWPEMQSALELTPKLNRAVMFRPFQGSVHWVSTLTAQAPKLGRFTWTLHYH